MQRIWFVIKHLTHRSYVNCSFVFLIADPFKCSCVHLKRTKYQCITENALRRRQNRSRQQHLFKKFYSVSYATGRVSCVRLASRVELSWLWGTAIGNNKRAVWRWPTPTGSPGYWQLWSSMGNERFDGANYTCYSINWIKSGQGWATTKIVSMVTWWYFRFIFIFFKILM